MSEHSEIDGGTVRIGLLMETVQAQQQLAENGLAALQLQLRNLDAVVRNEVRETLVAEFSGLAAESGRATAALNGLRRAINLRAVLWSVLTTALPTVGSTVALWHWMPSASELAARRAQILQLQTQASQLERAGGRVDLRRCGDSQRLCVRVDMRAGAFGASGEYRVVSGY